MDGKAKQEYQYISDGVRTRLYSKNLGDINWLCIPGGPGADSRYYESMLDLFSLPGKVWLIDLPGNGDHDIVDKNYDFDQWLKIFIPTVKKFKNPAIIGHSFGAMITLLYPELEETLKAFIILNSAPNNWLIAAEKKKQEHNLPTVIEPLADFRDNPTPKTFKVALEACYPYYFTGDYKSKGDKIFSELPFNYYAAAWWQQKADSYDVKWVPQKVPCIIVGGSHDFITPLEVFYNDPRFKHIDICEITDAGHMPWADKPQEFKKIIETFIEEKVKAI